jgi:hypothetical protein
MIRTSLQLYIVAVSAALYVFVRRKRNGGYYEKIN